MYKNKISAVYKIVNTVTNDFYIGSSRNVKKRWTRHKIPSTWKTESDKQLYMDMQKYGPDKFRFQIIAPVMPEYLKQVEQEFIDMLHPTYNKCNAKGRNVERQKEIYKKWLRTDKGKESMKKARKKYANQLCFYKGETLTLHALETRFRKAGIPHATLEAKKYLIKS